MAVTEPNAWQALCWALLALHLYTSVNGCRKWIIQLPSQHGVAGEGGVGQEGAVGAWVDGGECVSSSGCSRWGRLLRRELLSGTLKDELEFVHSKGLLVSLSD